MRPSAVILMAGLLILAGCGPGRGPVVTLAGPVTITADRAFKRQVLRIANPTDAGALVVETDGVVLDLGGADLLGAPDDRPPDGFVGRGIVVRGARDVTIRNANIRGFKVAIYAEDAPGIRIENCDVSGNYRQRLESTPEREDVGDWLWGHENDADEWLRYGAGIYLLRCDGAAVINNRARNGQNGICLVATNQALVQGNDMSFMSGWGLAMWRTGFCRVSHNRFDYCVRGYSHGVYERGQDSTGILVYEQCSNNLFACNSATHGGDGLFLYAGNETVKGTGEGGCNRNVVWGNDFSYAVANGIEATFSDRNVFVGNKLDHCRHGVWAGYSRNTQIVGNQINDCRHGVSIEHGFGNRIDANTFERCRTGVQVWWDDDKDLLASAFGQRWGGRSEDERVLRNVFRECRTAVRAASSTRLHVEKNTFHECDQVLLLEGTATAAAFNGNVIEGGRIENKTQSPLAGQDNWVSKAVACEGPVTWRRQWPDRLSAWSTVSADRAGRARTVMSGIAPKWADALGSVGGFPVDGEPPWPAALAGVPVGKANIFVDEWGPYDFASARLHPRRAVGWGSVSVQVLGPRVAFDVVSVDGDVAVTPSEGVAPAVVTIRQADGAHGVSPYAVVLKVGGKRLAVTGTLMRADWDVAYYGWSEAVDPRGRDEAWRQIVTAGPILQERAGKIDFVWGGRGPGPGLPGDRFAAVATTSMVLPAGRWTLRTISDDGVRLFVDGRKLIDNWTWHVPTEDSAILETEDGPHAIRIEYFEIDGHAQLQFFLEPDTR